MTLEKIKLMDIFRQYRRTRKAPQRRFQLGSRMKLMMPIVSASIHDRRVLNFLYRNKIELVTIIRDEGAGCDGSALRA
jgi:hypothetical protein